MSDSLENRMSGRAPKALPATSDHPPGEAALGRVMHKIGLVVFVVEALIMIAFLFHSPMPYVWLDVALDASVLTLLSSLLIYYTIIRPLDRKLRDTLGSLRDAEARSRAILDTAGEGVLTIDGSGRIESFNRAAERIFGYRAGEVVGQNAEMLWHSSKEDGNAAVPIHWAKNGGDTSFPGHRETLGRRQDGTAFPLEVSFSQFRHRGQRKLTGIVRDITERKRAEAEVKALNEQLIDAARRAGKAELATSVLHNVGNVLNSVNVSVALIHDRLHQSDISDLTKTANIMQQRLHEIGTYLTQDERGKHLPRFLAALCEKMAEDEQAIAQELRSLVRDIEHIKAIVAMQQSYAGVGGVIQEVSLADLLGDAIRINACSIERHGIEIVRQFDDLGPVLLDRQKVLQIIVNLISNAKYACTESGKEKKRIVVRLRSAGPGRATIQVCDNGSGIAAENLTRIFALGFTTRQDGHGFGLHSAALSADELDGSLTALSDGPGTGATFTLEIPYQEAGASVATLTK